MPDQAQGRLNGDQGGGFDWRLLIGAQLRDAGHDVEPSTLDVLVKIAQFAAEETIAAERNRYDRKIAELEKSYRVITEMITPLLSLLDMTPFERIVSVAVEDVDGDIRVVAV